MNETQKRIQALKNALPGLRERVAAVAVLLAISLVMMASASFAWVTLSRSPEVTGVATNVAANGNLEIALVGPDGSEPGMTAVGDSFASGKNVLEANLTWGNLVNLSDAAYGLENIVLRPALLGNVSDLLEKPLKGANYGGDGRVEQYYNEDYQFTNWTQPAGENGYFEYLNTPKYGVRAISTIQKTYMDLGANQFAQMMREVNGAWSYVGTDYTNMLSNSRYINALAGLIGIFMTDKLNESDTDIKEYMTDVYDLMVEFEEVVDNFAHPLTMLANVQLFNAYKDTSHAYTQEQFVEAYHAGALDEKISIKCLPTYFALVKELDEILWGTNAETDDCIADFYNRALNGGSVLFSEITSIVNKLVDIGSCQVILPDGTTYAVKSIGKSAATKLLGKDVDAVITTGILKNFEQLTGYRMCATNVTVKATYIFTVSMKAKTITTNAKDPYAYAKDVSDTEKSRGGEFVAEAQDTYGMALDFWVRTNVSGGYLRLEGNVLTVTETVRDTGTDAEGNPVDLYTVTVSTQILNEETGESETISDAVACYYDSENVLRNATSHDPIYNEDGSAPEGQTISNPMEKMKEIVTVTGFEGENRVWDAEGDNKNLFLSTDSTTQGSGSCYVFYAEDPTQQENSLRLLSNMRIAFVDCTEGSPTYGKMVAISKLDIERRFEESGRVTLPLVLFDDGSDYLSTTPEGDLTILPLERNKAVRLMAIVFMDGKELSNADVLAANDIHGRLNIQFGNTKFLETLGDTKLESAERSVSALSKKGSDSSYGETNTLIEYSYDDSDKIPMTVNVKVAVKGDQPAVMTAFFMRKVNETQGSREATFNLTKTGSEGEYTYWEGTYTFSSPGNYVLRTVQLDGVDYDLPSGNYPQVTVKGFELSNVIVSRDGLQLTASTTVLTDTNSVIVDLSAQLKSHKKLPSSVRLQFIKEDGTQVTANMTYDQTATTWNGKATFTSSGVYTLRFAIMDGEYTELESAFQREITVYMGIVAQVEGEPAGFDTVTREGNIINYSETYTGDDITTKVRVRLLDNSGNEVPYLSGVKLNYFAGGSSLQGMDPDLRWNASSRYYEGNLQISRPGIFTFGNVRVGDSTVTRTDGTVPIPKYTVISPEPPAYLDASPMEGYDYLLDTIAGDDSYKIGVRINNAVSATVTATIKNADEQEPNDLYYVTTTVSKGGTIAEENVFMFTLPQADDASGYQHGDWTITQLSLVDVYDENQVIRDADNPLVWDLSAGSSFWTDLGKAEPDDLNVKVVSTKVRVSDGENEDLNGGAFMGSSAATKPIVIEVTDQKGIPLDGNHVTLQNAKMTYTYTLGSSKEYGGYTAAQEKDIDLELTATATGNKLVMNLPTFSYAGKYVAKNLIFEVVSVRDPNNKRTHEFTSPEYKASQSSSTLPTLALPIYTLSTGMPYVKFTATNPAVGTTFTGANEKADATVERQNRIYDDGYSVEVFYQASATDNGCGGACSGYAASKATLTLYDAGSNFTNATCTIISKGEGKNVVYTFTPTAVSNEQSLGTTNDRKGLGTGAQATELVFTVGDSTYTFKLQKPISATAVY